MLKCLQSYPFLSDHFQFGLIYQPHLPGPYEILFFKALDFTFLTRHSQGWVSFPLCLILFIPSIAISTLFSSSILDTYWPGAEEGFIIQCDIFWPFHTVYGKNDEVVCHSLLQWTGFIQNSPLTCPSWVALQGITHSFIKLHKAGSKMEV